MAQIYAVLNAGSANVTFDSTSSLADGEFLAAELGQLYAAGILRNTVVAGPPGPSPFAPDPTNLLTVTGSPAETLFLSPSISAVVVSAPTEVDLNGEVLNPDGPAGSVGFTVVGGNGGLVFKDITPTGPTATDYVVTGGGDNDIETAPAEPISLFLRGVQGFPETGNYNIATGDGDDTIAIADGNATIQPGGGHNFVALGSTGPVDALVVSDGYDSIIGNTIPLGTSGSGGTDTVDVTAGQTTILPGSSNFFVNDASPNPISLFAASGSDTVYATGGAQGTVQGGFAGNNLLVGDLALTTSQLVLQGGGNGDLLASEGFGQTTLLGGAGNEQLNAALARGNVVLQAGTGNDTLVTTTYNPVLTGSNGDDTVRGAVGTGSSALILITPFNVAKAVTLQFTLGAGGGSDTVVGFGQGDFAQFAGYGASPLANASVTAAGTAVTLSDGTHILFAGTAAFAPGQVTAR